ncbi:MAG: hypothetical protein WCP91_03305 [Candidatus Berkelbacteria bacterium]
MVTELHVEARMKYGKAYGEAHVVETKITVGAQSWIQHGIVFAPYHNMPVPMGWSPEYRGHLYHYPTVDAQASQIMLVVRELKDKKIITEELYERAQKFIDAWLGYIPEYNWIWSDGGEMRIRYHRFDGSLLIDHSDLKHCDTHKF